VSWELLIALVAGIGGPASGIAVAVIADRRSKREHPTAVDVSQKTVKVSEREAATHEIAVIIDGFNTSMTNLRADVTAAREDSATARAEAREAREEHGLLKEKHEALTDRVETSERERAEMIRHIVALENLIPNPPGPPPRPDWSV
jgi:outer membrane murein-binding lipoprotein Lpp